MQPNARVMQSDSPKMHRATPTMHPDRSANHPSSPAMQLDRLEMQPARRPMQPARREMQRDTRIIHPIRPVMQHARRVMQASRNGRHHYRQRTHHPQTPHIGTVRASVRKRQKALATRCAICDITRTMARGPSGRLVIEMDPILKRDLHSALAADGITLKDWFLKHVSEYVADRRRLNIVQYSADLDEPSARVAEEPSENPQP